jgi:hypothetical protein
MSNSENDGSKGCLIFAAVIFGLAALSTALGFVFGGKSFLSDFLDEDSEGTNIGYLRTTFILLVIAGGIFVYNNYIKKDKK